MKDLKITKVQLELIEKMGVVNERSGMQPIASRVLALLLVSDRTELTFEEIQKILSISKSSASVAINLLLTMNRIDYITKAGDRKRYFRSNIFNWKDDMKQSLARMTEKNELLKEILAQRPKTTKEFNTSLGEIIEFFDFFNKEIPHLFKKFSKE